MGAGQSTQTQNINNFISQVTVASLTKNSTSCKAEASVNQSLVVNDDLTDAVPKCNATCVGVTPSAAQYCYATCSYLAQGVANSSFTAGTISQTAQATLAATCQVTADTTHAVTQDVSSAISQAMNNTTDSLGSALNGIVSSISKSSDSTVNKNTVTSLVNNTMTTENLATFVTNVSATQSAVLNLGVTTTTINNLTQFAAAQAMGQMIASNTTINNATQSVSVAATQSQTNTNEILPGLQAGIASLLGGIGNLFSSPLLIVGAVVLVLLIVVLMVFK